MIICVTNRKLCVDDFIRRLKVISQTDCSYIILREKDLCSEEYENLFINCINELDDKKYKLIIHSNLDLIEKLNYDKVHLPYEVFINSIDKLKNLKEIGVSIHSLEEAKIAQNLGATYLIFGHIFQTDCKKDLQPRGLDFLKYICDNIDIPVYAIGGVNKNNIEDVLSISKGACIMSSFMTTPLHKLNEISEKL